MAKSLFRTFFFLSSKYTYKRQQSQSKEMCLMPQSGSVFQWAPCLRIPVVLIMHQRGNVDPLLHRIQVQLQSACGTVDSQDRFKTAATRWCFNHWFVWIYLHHVCSWSHFLCNWMEGIAGKLFLMLLYFFCRWKNIWIWENVSWFCLYFQKLMSGTDVQIRRHWKWKIG